MHSINWSTDGKSWGTVTSQTTYGDTDTPSTTIFGPVNARYLRLTATSEAGNRGVWSSAGEIIVGYVGNAAESNTDIDFHAPWATKYIKIANADGTLDNRGLIFSGQDRTNYAKNPWIYQDPVPDYGMSVTAFAVSIPKAYDFSNAHTRSLFADVAFGGFFFAPLTGRWMDWTFETIADVGTDVVVGADTGPNLVYCVNGKSCATIFANGKFQFTATTKVGQPMTALSPPQLYSWWTDVVWHKMRVSPGLKTSAQAGV